MNRSTGSTPSGVHARNTTQSTRRHDTASRQRAATGAAYVRVIVRALAAQLCGDLGGSSLDEPSACHLDIVRHALTNNDPPQATPSTITAVIVCYDEEPEQIRSAVDTLLTQT